jgi:hypothetical protein
MNKIYDYIGHNTNPINKLPSYNIKYYGKVTKKEEDWLIIRGRASYSGGELRPIFLNDIFIGGISWNLGGIDYIIFLPEFKNKGYLKYIVHDNIENGRTDFVSASNDLEKKLSNYGDVYRNPNNDITSVIIKN